MESDAEESEVEGPEGKSQLCGILVCLCPLPNRVRFTLAARDTVVAVIARKCSMRTKCKVYVGPYVPDRLRIRLISFDLLI